MKTALLIALSLVTITGCNATQTPPPDQTSGDSLSGGASSISGSGVAAPTDAAKASTSAKGTLSNSKKHAKKKAPAAPSDSST